MVLGMCWGLTGLSLYSSPDEANVQLSLLGYCSQVEDGRFVRELLAPPVAPHTAGPAEQMWAEEAPLPLGGFSSWWAPWELESAADLGSLSFCVPDSTAQIHICMMPMKHRLPVMKYSCLSPKGLQHGKSMRPSRARPPPPRTQAICAAEGVAVGSAVRSRQIQAADLCL